MNKNQEMLDEDNPDRDGYLDSFTQLFRSNNSETPSEYYGRNGLLTALERELGYGSAPRFDRGRF